MRSIFLLIILTLCTSFISATKNITKLSTRVLYKCCSFGKIVGDANKKCVDYNKTLSFSSIKVYDEYFYETGKSIKDVFALIAGMFDNEEIKNKTMDITAIPGFLPRVTQNGELFLEIPNAYDRWTMIPSEKFCMDHRLYRNKENLRVWAISPDPELNYENNIYFTVASLISCFFMLLVLIAYIILLPHFGDHGKIMISYVTNQFLAFLLLAVMKLMEMTAKSTCVALTTAFYFFILASFFWMNVMSYDILKVIRNEVRIRDANRSQGRHDSNVKFRMYCLYAWGVPLAMSIMLVVLNEIDMSDLPWFITPNIGTFGCFLEGGQQLVYLYCPMLILIIGNWIIYLMTALSIWNKRRDSAFLKRCSARISQGHLTDKDWFLICLKLTTVMGLNWLLEVVSFLYPGFKLWYLTDLFNSLTGFFIFIIFICKRSVFKMLWERTKPETKNYSNNTSGSYKDYIEYFLKAKRNERSLE